jgi:hypothetical protein
MGLRRIKTRGIVSIDRGLSHYPQKRVTTFLFLSAAYRLITQSLNPEKAYMLFYSPKLAGVESLPQNKYTKSKVTWQKPFFFTVTSTI